MLEQLCLLTTFHPGAILAQVEPRLNVLDDYASAHKSIVTLQQVKTSKKFQNLFTIYSHALCDHSSWEHLGLANRCHTRHNV
jgi:hypothetical protein